MEPDATRDRIAELERQLAEAIAAAQGDEGSAESAYAMHRITELTNELGHLLQADPNSVAPRAESPHAPSSWQRRRFPVVRAGLLAVVIGCVAVGALIVINANRGDTTGSATDYGDASIAMTTVPRGGQLRVGANLGAKKAIACNDGHLTLYGTGVFSVTGHCASLTTGAVRSQVSVERADLVNITGFDSEYFISGDFAALTVTADDNKVQIDSVDTITLSGDDNVVSYQSGPPEVADVGDGNVVAEKK